MRSHQVAFFLLFFFGLLSAPEPSGSISTFSSTCNTSATPAIDPLPSNLVSGRTASADSRGFSGSSLQLHALASSPRTSAVKRNDTMHAGLHGHQLVNYDARRTCLPKIQEGWLRRLKDMHNSHRRYQPYDISPQ